MSATNDLLQDHIFIRRLQVVIEKCYTLLYEGKDVPFGDLVKIADMIELFVDNFHHGKEEKSYFPEAEGRDDHYSDEIRRFVLEHEFGRRIAKRMRIYLEEFLHGKDSREPLARYLKTYSIFILDHTSKEDRFFSSVKERQSFSENEEKQLKQQFEQIKHNCLHKTGNNNDDMAELLKQLEDASWAR